jgi:hypothetical protein
VDAADDSTPSQSSYGLEVNTPAGDNEFAAAVGGGNVAGSDPQGLEFLRTDETGGVSGRTEIGAATIDLYGASARFNDAVLLQNNLVVTEGGTGDVEFASTVDSAEGSNYTLEVVTGSGATIFGGAVGGDALGVDSDDGGLGAVTTNSTGTTAINGGLVRTTGTQTYNDPVTLGAASTSLNGTSVAFVQTLNGSSALTINAGTTTFGGTVGNATPLTSLETDPAGTTAINGGGADVPGSGRDR